MTPGPGWLCLHGGTVDPAGRAAGVGRAAGGPLWGSGRRVRDHGCDRRSRVERRNRSGLRFRLLRGRLDAGGGVDRTGRSAGGQLRSGPRSVGDHVDHRGTRAAELGWDRVRLYGQRRHLGARRELTAPDGAPGDGFASAIALAGSTAVFGAPQAGSGGAAYIFTGAGSAWSEQAGCPRARVARLETSSATPWG